MSTHPMQWPWVTSAFYLNGLKPFTPAGQRVENERVDHHLLEFRLPGTWLVQNEEQTVTLLYQLPATNTH
jgi:hypothetical protein